MKSKQYEELCRLFLAEMLGIGISDVFSEDVPCAHLPNKPEYKTQIDLYWFTGDTLCEYFNIANAKWRGSDKVEQGEVQLLCQVAQDIRAHKAVMITSSDFTAGARTVAENKGIALHIVRPEFDYSGLHPKNATIIQEQIQELRTNLSQPLYSHEIVHRALDLAVAETADLQTDSAVPVSGSIGGSYQNRMVTGYENRAYSPPSNTSLGSGGGSAGANRGGTPGGYSTRQGGGSDFRTK